MTLVYLGIGWLGGLAWAATCPLRWHVWLVLSALPLTAAILRRDDRRQWRAYLALTFAFWAAARYRALPRQAELIQYNGQGWGTFEGYVAAEPDPGRDWTRLTVMVQRAEAIPVSGLALLDAPRYPTYQYGDRLRFSGRLETPPTGDTFSYREYLAGRQIFSVMSRPVIERLPGHGGSAIRRGLLHLKASAQRVVNQILPDPEAAILSGILLGNDNGIPDALMDSFDATGTTHIIVISGSNISLLIAVLLAGLGRLVPQRTAGLVTFAVIAVYTAFVGADPPVVRAAVMGILLTAGQLLGRQPFGPASLLAAAMGMTASKPTLIHDIGFQLSFAATLGLMVYTGPLRARGVPFATRSGGHAVAQVAHLMRDWLGLTVAAQVATLPLLAFHFGRLSLVSLFTNLLIIPAQQPLMILGGLATISGLAWLPVGHLVAWTSYPFLRWTTWVAEVASTWPFASIQFHLNAAALVASYGLMAGLTWAAHKLGGIGVLWRHLTSGLAVKISLASAGLSLLAAASLVASQPDGRLHVFLLDVGEGEAILIQTPTGRRILVDGGPDPSAISAHLGRRLSFWERSLDVVVATHPDTEHVNGLPAVLERYRVGALLIGSQSDGPAAWTELLQMARDGGIQTIAPVRGQSIQSGDGVRLEVLHPTARPAERQDNRSVVLRLCFKNATVLLTGDIEAEVEQELIEAGAALESTVLKAADGGDRSGTSLQFLQAVNPQMVILSVGEDNPYHHPAPTVQDRLAGLGRTVLRTDERGTIHLITDGDRFWVDTQRH